MSPSAKRAARGRLRSTAYSTTRDLKSFGEGVPCLTLTEAQWQARVIGLAGFYGWRCFHPPDNVPRARLSVGEAALRKTPAMSARQLLEVLRRSERAQDTEAGFPDLTMVRNDEQTGPELVFAELKREGGRMGRGQPEWAEALGAVAAAVGVLDEMGANQRWTAPTVAVEHHLWRPSDEGVVHARLARGRGRVEPAWYVGELA